MAKGIKDKVAIIGMGCSKFGERWDSGTEQLLAEAFDEARTILTRRRADLDQGAELLLKKEAITAEDFPALQQTKPVGKLPVAPVASS